MNSQGMGSSSSAPFHWFSQSVLVWVEQSGASGESRYLSLWLPSFSDLSLHTFQEIISTLRGLNMLNRYINSPGKNLALNLFVHNNAHHMLGDVVVSSGFSMGTFVGTPF